MRIPSLLGSMLLLSACGTHITLQGNEPLDFNTSAYAAPAERVRMPDEDTRALYQAVLKFYRPGPGRARWLDRAMLPSDRGEHAAMLDSDMAVAIISDLGEKFCILGEDECDGKNAGGTLRISPVYQLDSVQARVIVEFKSREPHGPETSSSLAFLMKLDGRAWRILSLGPTGNPT
jgi:hypothetical protein